MDAEQIADVVLEAMNTTHPCLDTDAAAARQRLRHGLIAAFCKGIHHAYSTNPGPQGDKGDKGDRGPPTGPNYITVDLGSKAKSGDFVIVDPLFRSTSHSLVWEQGTLDSSELIVCRCQPSTGMATVTWAALTGSITGNRVFNYLVF